MKKTWSVALAIMLITAVIAAEELSGVDILQKMLNRYRGDNSIITVVLTKAKIDNPDDRRSFEITTYSLVRPEIHKALVAVRRAKSKSSKPILFLVWDWQDPKKEDQLWYCLPSIGNYNKISSDAGEKMTEKYGFSIEEMKTRDLDRAIHTGEGLVDYEGEECYKVVSIPKKPKKEGFSKIVTYVRPGSWTAAYVEYTGLDGKPLKKIRVNKIEQIDGIWSEMAGKQEDYEKKYSVTFQIKSIDYKKRLPSKLFSFNEPPKDILEGN